MQILKKKQRCTGEIEKVIILLHSLTTEHLLDRMTKKSFNLSNGTIAELQAGTKLHMYIYPEA
jgi:hypothetical protein